MRKIQLYINFESKNKDNKCINCINQTYETELCSTVYIAYNIWIFTIYDKQKFTWNTINICSCINITIAINFPYKEF